MKKFIIALIALFALNASAISIDNPVYPILPTDKLRTEIIELIGLECPLAYEETECRAAVFFKVNENNEIVVLNIVSQNKNACSYFTKKLGGKKVSDPLYDVDQIYFLPVRLVGDS